MIGCGLRAKIRFELIKEWKGDVDPSLGKLGDGQGDGELISFTRVGKGRRTRRQSIHSPYAEWRGLGTLMDLSGDASPAE